MHSFSKLSTVIYFLQIILYRIKATVSYFTLFSAFGFAIVCSRYNDDDTKIYLCKMTNHLCWRVGKKKIQLAPDSQKLTSRLKEAYNGSETNFDNHWLLYSYNFCLMLFFKLASLGIWTNTKIFRNRFVSKHLEPYLHMISTVKERLRCLKYFSLPLGWIDVRYSARTNYKYKCTLQ